VSRHTAFVAGFARDRIEALVHANGQRLVRIHNSFKFDESTKSSLSGFEMEDPRLVIGLSLFDPNGSLIGHNDVEHLTTIAGIQRRTGGMCNASVLARVCGPSDEELKELYEGGRIRGDHGACFCTLFRINWLSVVRVEEFGRIGGKKPLDGVRISFGASSTADDVLSFIGVLQRFFLISNEALSISSSIPSPLHSPPPQPAAYLLVLRTC
jgi:hypothetical protein